MIKKVYAVIILAMLLTFSAQAKTVEIEDRCIRIADIYPATGNMSKIYCGIDYGESKKVGVMLSKYIIDKYELKKASPDEFIIKRKGIMLNEMTLKKMIANRLKERHPDMQFTLERLRITKNISAKDAGDVSVIIPKNRFGTTAVTVDNGFKKSSVTVFIRPYKEGYVLTKRVNKGETFRGKVEKKWIDLTRIRGTLLKTTEGLIADRNMSKGKPLTEMMTSKKPAQVSGTPVRIVYKTETLSVETKGILEQDAFVGKIVRIKNIDSGKIVSAKYLGNKTAQTNF